MKREGGWLHLDRARFVDGDPQEEGTVALKRNSNEATLGFPASALLTPI